MSKGQSENVILFWTKFFGNDDHFVFRRGRAAFSNCQRTGGRPTCLATSDRGLFNDSAAILFHGRDLDPNDLPPPNWRQPSQHYIFILYESPVHTDMEMLRDDKFKNYFNRTMTYRRDSDIVDLVSGHIKCKDTSPPRHTTCHDFPSRTTSKTPQTIIGNESKGAVTFKIDLKLKNRTIAWFVSNCLTNSKRELLAHRLSLYIPVDIYGGCFNQLNCPRGEEGCDRMLSQHYRFYLSFENSLCPDYVTEKVYRPMMYDTVPVVFGGSDYSLYLPDGSYVDAMNFSSPLELADHLKTLMEDDELYLTYFRWRERYVVEPSALEGVCKLCQLLSDTTVKEKTYSDIEAWWAGRTNNNKTCFPPPSSLVSSDINTTEAR